MLMVDSGQKARTPRFSSYAWIKPAGYYLLALSICLVFLVWVLRLWQTSLSLPFFELTDGDGLFTGTVIKGLIENGWYFHNNMVGFPSGLNMLEFPSADNLHWLIIKAISLFSSDWALVMNLFYLATFPLTVVTSLFVFRRLDISYPVAVVGSVLFAFAPYHFDRGEGQLFLTGIYIIPLSILAVLLLTGDNPPFIKKGQGGEAFDFWNLRSAGFFAIAFLTASAGIYYAYFTAFFLLVAGVYTAVNNRSWRRLAAAGVLLGILAAGLLINFSLSIVHILQEGRNPEIAMRSARETMVYATNITSLVLPVSGHRIPILAKITQRALDQSNLWTFPLGTVAAAGYVFLLGWLILARRRDPTRSRCFYSRLDVLSVLNISAILLTVVGGFGMLFSLFVTPEIRANNRIEIFIGLFGIMAVLILLELAREKYAVTARRQKIFLAVLFLILFGGLLDQTSDSIIPVYSTIRAKNDSDQVFVKRIESVLPPGSPVFQLPYLPFPENGPINRMVDYDHFRAYLHSSDLFWSYGAMRGRENDLWQRRISRLSPGQLLGELAGAGYRGVYINRDAYEDNAAALVAQLEDELQVAPVNSDDGSLIFLDMTGYLKRSGYNP